VAGYSGTPLAKKLGINPGTTVALLDAEAGVITDLPPDVTLKSRAGGSADVVVFFVTSAVKLERRLPALEPITSSVRSPFREASSTTRFAR
jgi:hypothetical protein